jgi:acyl dehydratase
MSKVAFEDFAPGTQDLPGSTTVTRDDIVAYARAYDPQPFHLDEEAAQKTFAGGLIASGWHSCAMLMRLVADGLLLDSTCMGAPGIEEVRWLKPVRPGDTVRARCTTLGTRVSRSRPEMGFVHFRLELLNQRQEMVLSQVNWIMFGRRDASAVPSPGEERSSGKPEASARPNGSAVPERAAPPAEAHDLGSHHFDPEEIIRFARAFDPQPFHIDSDAAARSHFGALCASGWHTAAVWMRRMVEYRRRAAEAMLARGEQPPALGVSPGFTDLRWLKPVYAGDTIAYASTLLDERPSASRPGWSLASSRNTGVNQHGERVFEFTGKVFVKGAAGPVSDPQTRSGSAR